MGTVTGMTYDKVIEITDEAVVGASIDADTGVLTLQTRGGVNINAGNVNTNAAKLNAVKAAYPVGAFFISNIATNPATQLGFGTWVEAAKGRVLVGVDATQAEFDTVGKTGGSKTHTLTLTEMPRHSHTGDAHTHSIAHDHPSFTTAAGGAHTHSPAFSANPGSSATNIAMGTATNDRYSDAAFNDTSGSDATHSHVVDVPSFSGSSGAATAASTGSTGGNSDDGSTQPHNNLPPYVTCYIWRRTA